jgi:hypothetical protein
MDKKMVVKIGGLLLCVLFFTAPLVQCSQDNSLSATGLEIATHTGELMSKADTGYPIVFVLLIVPVILAIVAFKNNSFSTLRNISVVGLVAQIIFMIAAYAMMNSGKGSNSYLNGAFELVGFNWLIIALYIGLISFTQYCVKQEITVNTGHGSSSLNLGNISPLGRIEENKKCKMCGKSVDSGYTTCPHCGASNFE